MQYCRDGWPRKNPVDPVLKLYWEMRGELTVGANHLLCDGHTVVPESLQEETLHWVSYRRGAFRLPPPQIQFPPPRIPTDEY